MELFQVRYFLALAKILNFTRAAEACNVTQPAMTRAIQRLEEELGGPLLYRERSLTQLTELGRVMLPHLEAAFLAAQTASAQAAAFKRRDAAPLRLGLNATISARILTAVLHELEDRVRAFELTLIEGNSDALFARMLDGEIDAAVVVDPERLPDRINRWPLFEDRCVVLCEPGHRFAQLGEITAAALAEEQVLARSEDGCDFDRLFDLLCPEGDNKRAARHRGGSEDHIQHMVGAGLGVAVSCASQPFAANIAVIPLAEPEASRLLVVTAVAGRPHSPCLAAFLKLMRARDWRSAAEARGGATDEAPASKP
jgi:DNA-binding transcriptional LysR family regulator